MAGALLNVWGRLGAPSGFWIRSRREFDSLRLHPFYVREQGNTMPWNNKAGHVFTEANITAHAPTCGRVYGVYSGQRWIYFGETDNIDRRLREHLKDVSHDMHKHAPLAFSFEEVPVGRVARQKRAHSGVCAAM